MRLTAHAFAAGWLVHAAGQRPPRLQLKKRIRPGGPARQRHAPSLKKGAQLKKTVQAPEVSTNRSFVVHYSELSADEAARCRDQQLTFNNARLPQIGGTGDWWCRGWPMLFDETGIAPVVSRASAAGVAGERLAALDVVDCNGRGRLAGLSLYVSMVAPGAVDAVTWSPGAQRESSREILDANRIRVWWTPAVEGTYNVTVRLLYYNDRCHRQTSVLGTYLGSLQRRTTTYDFEPCDSVSVLPTPEPRLRVAGPSTASEPRQNLQCRDGETADGSWMSTRGPFSWTGAPPAGLVFLRPHCAYHFFAADQAVSCLSSTAVYFVGDSLIRYLYAAFVRLLGGDADENEIKHRTTDDFGDGRVEIRYFQNWDMYSWKSQAQPALKNVRPNGRRVVVIANFGVVHQQDDVCTQKLQETLLEMMRRLFDIVQPSPRLILHSPSFILSYGNPTLSPARSLLTLRIMRDVHPEVIDFSNLTRARRDLSHDGVHYKSEAAAVVLLNMLCPRPTNDSSSCPGCDTSTPTTRRTLRMRSTVS